MRIFIFLDSCDSLKVRDLPLIHESLKWILRYAQYDEKVDCHDLLKASLAMTKHFRFQATSTEVALGDFQGNFVLWVFEREAMR